MTTVYCEQIKVWSIRIFFIFTCETSEKHWWCWWPWNVQIADKQKLMNNLTDGDVCLQTLSSMNSHQKWWWLLICFKYWMVDWLLRFKMNYCFFVSNWLIFIKIFWIQISDEKFMLFGWLLWWWMIFLFSDSNVWWIKWSWTSFSFPLLLFYLFPLSMSQWLDITQKHRCIIYEIIIIITSVSFDRIIW